MVSAEETTHADLVFASNDATKDIDFVPSELCAMVRVPVAKVNVEFLAMFIWLLTL